mmetsp:Transcript_79020/g.256229  ORF Transcript_79020/g.256229 Transcript_79020/m.256229 type:complete len:678 (-) Transcript_79020:65-2098(-)
MPFDFENPPVQEGHRQHHTVAPNRWCVTRQDLIEFRCLVKKHVAEGKIAPTELDPFDPNDACIGPCVHTVVKQLIVPVTEKAGNASWALMLHPDGLECDLFVTHCWLEGIFEFIDKVLNSWPRGARHAYCCMLSNPQNLDIGHLLSIPRESPFALALMSARYMLVVPNRKCSIYSRIWCTYEAFIAYSESKFIFVATPPLKGALHRVLLLLAIEFVVAIASGILLGTSGCSTFDSVNMFVFVRSPALGCITLLYFLRPSRATQVVALVAVLLSGMCAGLTCATCYRVWLNYCDYYISTFAGSVVDAVWSLALCVATAVAEVDRLWAQQSVEEAFNLRRDFTGDLRDAKSLVESDRERILCELELSGQEHRVNFAIEVLLTSGMSTPSLQAAAETVGLLEQAGYWNLSITSMIWVSWVSKALVSILYVIETYSVQLAQHEESSKWEKVLVNSLCLCLPLDVVAEKCNEDPGCLVGGRCTIGHARLDMHDLEVPLRSSYCDPIEPPLEPFADWHFWVFAFSCLQALVWLGRFRRQGKDKRGFAASAMVTLIGPFLVVMVAAGSLIQVVFEPTDPRLEQSMDRALHVEIFGLHLVLAPLALMLCFAGPGHTAKVPVLVRCVVRCLMTHRSCGCSVRAKPKRKTCEQPRSLGMPGSTEPRFGLGDEANRQDSDQSRRYSSD